MQKTHTNTQKKNRKQIGLSLGCRERNKHMTKKERRNPPKKLTMDKKYLSLPYHMVVD